MRVINSSTPIRLSDKTFWFLTFSLVLLLPLVVGLSFANQLYGWYLVEFVAPELEKTLGFRGGQVTIAQESGSYSTYAVVTVTPGGIFDRAGVAPGDRPVGYVHGVRVGFISHLHHSRGQSVILSFVPTSRSGNGQAKKVSLTIP